MINLIVVVLFVAAAFYALLRARYSGKTFILCYHKVDYYKSGYRGIVVEPEKFFKQMRYLYRRGYRTMPLEGLCSTLKAKKKIPEKAFVVTFDDGYENFYLYAMPILKKYSFGATMFLSAGFIGKTFQYPHQPEEKHLDADQIKKLLPDVDFGAHTITHPDLTSLSDEKAAWEINESRRIVQKITGGSTGSFCYPYGRYDAKVKETVRREGFSCSCTTKCGLVGRDSDLLELPRFEFKEWGHMSPRDFFRNFDFYAKTFFGM
jgi:peptidoglycan/xylan/chitin deacetylase (PgdA/CDA1 family)